MGCSLRLFQAIVALLCSAAVAAALPPAEAARYEREAGNVTIVRDDWGIAHVHGKSDADAVFGALYAQAEDDFNRVETNYLTALGRLAEAEGEAKIHQDLRQRLFIDPVALQTQYAVSPAWLKALMNAFADGLNFYLAKHPEVKPRVITHFEPWMALSFTEGSIGGDIERIDLDQLAAFYGGQPPLASRLETWHTADPGGSNGFAIGPARSADGSALLLINPHTSFFFRSELQMTSEEGLNAYGAATWGQFFIYQGFNERAGWMHTSSGVDAVDEYRESISRQGDRYFYRYGGETRPVRVTPVTIRYRTASGAFAEKKFTTFATQHGPVIRAADGKWVSIQLMQQPIKALMQSYLRTKARDYQSFRQTMELKANSSNNTVFADADGDIAYFHGNFIPRRDPSFDYTKPVDGSNPATDWHGLLTVDETPHLLNPKSGWLFNVNDSPWSGAGASSLKQADYPAYVETGIESARGRHAVRVLEAGQKFTLDSLIAAAYDSYLPWFATTIPALVEAFDRAPSAQLTEQIDLLRHWDLRWSADSVPTSLAVFWGDELLKTASGAARSEHIPSEDYVARQMPPGQLLEALDAASRRLTNDFGTWQTPWGEINRFQRLTAAIVQPFNDNQPSIPVPFTSSVWGSLASFGAKPYPGTKKWYGTSGNSFVAVVEFGKQVSAKAVTAGGESGHPDSPHFDDEAQRYADGNLREVFFYPSQLAAHTARSYHPGAAAAAGVP